MKGKSKKLLSILLAAALIIGLFAAIPLSASAADDQFQVTLHPKKNSAYSLGQVANPLEATFEYKWNAGHGDIADVKDFYGKPYGTIYVEWYWNYSDSNDTSASGCTLFGWDYNISYSSEITHKTSVKPSTDELGVKYYFAVIKYVEYNAAGILEGKKTVTNTARVQVDAPNDSKYSFRVKKVDENGNLLSDAVLTLAPNKNYPQDPSVIAYDKTTVGGYADFAATPGEYILSEKQAPPGYNATDDKYYITITDVGVFLNINSLKTAYETVTFVNKKITTLNKDFRVKKVDENGNLLSGAVLTLAPNENFPQDASVITYDKTTVGGYADFAATPGQYILSEKQAPTGFNATDDKYYITITDDGVFLNINSKLDKYEMVTFVNKPIPLLNKDDHFAFMQGYEDGTFRPGRNMSRAEAVVMFSRLLMKSMSTTTNYRNDHYPDVVPTDWFSNEVGYMQMLGVLANYSRDGKFRPNEPVTRAEFATLAAHFDNLALTDTNAFSDVPISHWAVKYINSAAAKGWITGYPNGTFMPESNITRAEVVTLVGRMLNRKADSAYLAANASSLPRTYTDFKSDHWAYLAIMEASIGHDYTRDGENEKWTAVKK